MNQFSVGYNRIFDYITSQGTGSCESSQLGIPGANLGCGSGTTCVGSSCGLTSTQIVGGGYWSLGDRGYSPFQGGTNIFTINDTFDMIRGKHDIRVGGGIRINEMNVRAEGFQDGFWVIGGAWTSDNFNLPGNSEADVLLGLASLRIHDQNFNGDITGRRWKLFRPFVQDDWRVSKNLTLNLGLAWAIATPISEAAGREADFIPSATSYQLFIPGNGCTADLQPCQEAGRARECGWIARRLNRALAPRGKCSGAIRPWFGAATQFTTTPHGAWARKGCGRIRHSPRSLSVFPLGDAPR